MLQLEENQVVISLTEVSAADTDSWIFKWISAIGSGLSNVMSPCFSLPSFTYWNISEHEDCDLHEQTQITIINKSLNIFDFTFKFISKTLLFSNKL